MSSSQAARRSSPGVAAKSPRRHLLPVPDCHSRQRDENGAIAAKILTAGAPLLVDTAPIIYVLADHLTLAPRVKLAGTGGHHDHHCENADRPAGYGRGNPGRALPQHPSDLARRRTWRQYRKGTHGSGINPLHLPLPAWTGIRGRHEPEYAAWLHGRLPPRQDACGQCGHARFDKPRSNG